MSATIIELQAENIKRIKAVRIVPKGNTVVVSGKNDQGKSSTLDSIDYAFRGEKAICDEPLRQGEKRGVVRLKLSQELSGICTIERRFTPGGTVLEVKNAEGVPQKTPQALLDSIISKVTFDPLSFIRMKAPEQLELLRKLVGLDFTQINAERKRAFDERTVRNRELESAKAKMAGYPFNPNLPQEPVSVVDLAKKLSDLQTHNEGNVQKRRAFEKRQADCRSLVADEKILAGEVEDLEKRLAQKREQLLAKRLERETAENDVKRMESEVSALANFDETQVRAEIVRVQETNAQIEANRRHIEARNEVVRIEGEIKALTQAIQEFDAEKAAQIEFAEFPMPNLSFDEERGVLLNNVPFAQGSQARQLQAAVSIGLALNPQIRVILIRDGSLLDEDSMKLVSEMVAKANAQLWIEVVGSKDPAAIVIEDGEVRS